MDATDLAKALGQIVLALGTLAGIAVALSSLTRGERLRRRIKTHIEILKDMPDCVEAELLERLIRSDVNQLFDLAFPGPMNEYEKWAKLEKLAALSLSATGAASLTVGAFAGFQTPMTTVLAAAMTIGSSVALGARLNQQRILKKLTEEDEAMRNIP